MTYNYSSYLTRVTINLGSYHYGLTMFSQINPDPMCPPATPKRSTIGHKVGFPVAAIPTQLSSVPKQADACMGLGT